MSARSALTSASLALRTGGSIPQVGLGVWQAGRGKTTRDAVSFALRHGYRHIDTAAIYGNEADVGEGLRESGVARDEVFITTKLWNQDQGFDSALRAFDSSLKKLGLQHVDLYLIHWPVAGKRRDSWRALERLHAEKRARAIGVSNYLVPHLQELLADCEVKPAVNQIELTPFLQRRPTVDLCQASDIVVESYSPLTRGQRLKHPVLVDVAKAVGRSAAQVLLRWGIQKRVVVLPKSTNEQRIVENGALFDFELEEAAMKKLDALEEGLTTGWDPATQT